LKVFRADVQLRNAPIYSIIRPSDRSLVKQYIDTAKAWSPVIQNPQRSGGHGYCKFSVLRVRLVVARATYMAADDRYRTCLLADSVIPRAQTRPSG